MTTDESILQEMLERATNPDKATADELAVQMFCMVVRSNAELIHKALDIITEKIRSRNVNESIKAVELLEQCMSQCGSEFQDAVDKFKFLNDLIRLVAVKHQGHTTPAAIKTRILECLLLWTTDFPEKSKIRSAYDLLSKDNREEGGDSAANATKQESTLGIDEKMFAKLIHSGDPENLKRANLLVQHRVTQESRRTEAVLQHKSEIQEVQNTIKLLNEMLDTYEADEKDATEESKNLIRELYMKCKKHKPMMQRLPELMGYTDQDNISESIETNELLVSVLERYKQVIVHPKSTVQQPIPRNNESNTKNCSDILTEFLSDIPMITPVKPNVINEVVVMPNTVLKPKTTTANLDPLAELNDIFSNSTIDNSPQKSKPPNGLFSSFELLEPENVFSHNTNVEDQKQQTNEMIKLKDIDDISDDLFKESLPSKERIGKFKKECVKITLNEMVKNKTNIKPAKSTAPSSKPKAEQSSLTKELNDLKDDLMLDTDMSSEEISNNETTSLKTSSFKNETATPVKHLSEIDIDLDDITPSEDLRVLLDDDDVKVTFNFTKDRPSKNVSVFVISVANKSKMEVKDFQFEASVKKPSKVRLLPPTGTTMPPCKPFRPPTQINQVMLLLNPTGKSADVTCIVGYTLGDDPDPIKESIIVKDIKFVE